MEHGNSKYSQLCWISSINKNEKLLFYYYFRRIDWQLIYEYWKWLPSVESMACKNWVLSHCSNKRDQNSIEQKLLRFWNNMERYRFVDKLIFESCTYQKCVNQCWYADLINKIFLFRLCLLQPETKRELCTFYSHKCRTFRIYIQA